jgi:hypothetical protein
LGAVYKYVMEFYVVFVTLFDDLSYHEDVIDDGSVRSKHIVMKFKSFYFFEF